MEKIKKDELIFCAMLMIYAATDAWRDAWLSHGWWPRHVAKWIAFYLLPVYLLWKEDWLRTNNLKRLLWLAAGGFFLWEIFYMITQ